MRGGHRAVTVPSGTVVQVQSGRFGDGLTKLGGDTPQGKGPKVTASVLLFTCQAREF
jgi:hypothetical protein